MVGACQQNSGIFLVRGGGPDEIPAGAGIGLGAARDRTGCRRGQVADWERNEANGLLLRKTRWGWDEMPATKSHGQVADSERPGTGRDAGEGRGRDWDKIPVTKSPGRQRARSGQGPDEIPAGAEAGTGTRCRRENHRVGSGLGAARDRTGCRRENQLKRKRSIISSSNSGFSKSFSLVMIKLLCSKNPASW